MTNQNDLRIITIYHRPDDFPNLFIARESFTTSKGTVQGKVIAKSENLAMLLKLIPQELVFLPRAESDAPSILGCFI